MAIFLWHSNQLSGRSWEEIRQELEHSGDSIEIEVERPSPASAPASASASSELNYHDVPEQPIRRTSVGRMDPASQISDDPSPTRRRQLPQAPVVSIETAPASAAASLSASAVTYRLHLKIKCTVERHHCSLVVALIGAEKTSASGASGADDAAGAGERRQGTAVWAEILLTLPK